MKLSISWVRVANNLPSPDLITAFYVLSYYLVIQLCTSRGKYSVLFSYQINVQI